MPLANEIQDWEARHGLGSWEMGAVIDAVTGHVGSPRVVLEVGTFRGDSLAIWRGVWNPEVLIGIQDTDETTPETATRLGATMIRGKSQDKQSWEQVLKVLDGRWIDFLYLDGDHTYDAVMDDWRQYMPLVREGGAIVLHDAVIEDNETVDVYRLYRELRLQYQTALFYGGEGYTGAAVFLL